MSGVRTVASAVCIVMGVLLVAAWAASVATLGAVEDGTVIEDATATAIGTDAARQELADAGTAAVMRALGDHAVADVPALEEIVRGVVERIVSSQRLPELVRSQTAQLRRQAINALNSHSTGAIWVSIDVSGDVNALLAAVPVIGPSMPQVSVPAVPVQLMGAQVADRARTAWDALHMARTWCGWLGLAVLVAGIAVSHRRRWFGAKAALALAAVSCLIWVAVTAVGPQTLLDVLKGAATDSVAVDLVSGAQQTVATAMGRVALGAIIVAAVLFAGARVRRRSL